MLMINIFAWTGCIIWWLICAGIILCIAGACVLAPIVVFKKTQSHLWKWRITALLAKWG